MILYETGFFLGLQEVVGTSSSVAVDVVVVVVVVALLYINRNGFFFKGRR